MSERVSILPPGVSQGDSWPYARMPKKEYSDGPWKIIMDAAGTTVIWQADKPLPNLLKGFLEVYHGDRDQMDCFLTAFCSKGYEHTYKADGTMVPMPEAEKMMLVHQGGVYYRFNWVSGTMAQLNVASQIAKTLFEGTRESNQRAWSIGQNFEKKIREALNAAHAAQ